MKRLNEVFNEWKTGNGIFKSLQNFNVPWKDENINVSLDLEYFGNKSGEKPISPLVKSLLTGNVLTDNDITILSTAIMALVGTNWNKQWETLNLMYNPIENYSMIETMKDDTTVDSYGKNHTRTDNLSHIKTGTETDTPDLTEKMNNDITVDLYGKNHTRTDDLTHNKTGDEVRTPNLTETNTPDLTVETTNSVYGFNSDNVVDSDFQTSNSNGETTTVTNGTETTEYNLSDSNTGTVSEVDSGEDRHTRNYELKKSGNNTHTYNTNDSNTGTVSDVDSGEDTHTRNYELKRSGNIGVTTSQQMIESERNLWKWEFFYEVVFPDIDRVLTLNIY